MVADRARGSRCVEFCLPVNRVHEVTGFVYYDSSLTPESNVGSHSVVDGCAPAHEAIARVSTAVSRVYSGSRNNPNMSYCASRRSDSCHFKGFRLPIQ